MRLLRMAMVLFLAGGATWMLAGQPADLWAFGLAAGLPLILFAAPLASPRGPLLGRWSRRAYDIEEALSTLSHALASARTVEHVVAHTANLLTVTVKPRQRLFLVRDPKGRFRPLLPGQPAGAPVLLAKDLVAQLERPSVVWRQECEDGASKGRSIWGQLGAELLVPICLNGSATAILALGGKVSGQPYTARDIVFLRIAANQIALALSNAGAFDQLGTLNRHLERLNEDLEVQVRERTADLEASNAELNRSLDKLQAAYGQLEQGQSSLLRADRLATLGRLTAGLAHEINTPLGAVLNTLKVIGDLGREYESSIGDPDVSPDDHREIAAEILTNATAAAEWAHKAASFIRSVKVQSRDARATAQLFLVRDVVAETRGLVAHRLGTTSCQIDFEDGPKPVSLVGDPSRLGQVLVNLVTNALDAYEERRIGHARIEVRAERTPQGVTISVRDWAGGIPVSVLRRLFEEPYTTKGPGRGTGLGLWISRNLVEEGFGGTLDVVTNQEGSCFIAELPERRSVTALVPASGRDTADGGLVALSA